MKKIVKNGDCKWVLFSFILVCSVATSQSYQNIVIFDSLFPATWYQKSLEASLSVWNVLAQAFEKNNGTEIQFYELLGKLTFVQFCIKSMIREKVVCLPEDSDYLRLVLNKIKELVEIIVVGDENEDVVLCICDVILETQQLLNAK